MAVANIQHTGTAYSGTLLPRIIDHRNDATGLAGRGRAEPSITPCRDRDAPLEIGTVQEPPTFYSAMTILNFDVDPISRTSTLFACRLSSGGGCRTGRCPMSTPWQWRRRRRPPPFIQPPQQQRRLLCKNFFVMRCDEYGTICYQYRYPLIHPHVAPRLEVTTVCPSSSGPAGIGITNDS